MPNKRLERVVLRPALNPVLRAWGRSNAKHYDINNTIVVASSGRGGSTWLAEIIGSLPGYPLLYEPLGLNRNPEPKDYGFSSHNTYIPAGGEESLKQTYLHQLLTGANLSANVVSLDHFHPAQYLSFRGFLVKFIHANMLLYWMLQQFPIRAVLMIRHPCGAVASRIKHKNWAHITDDKNSFTLPQNITTAYPHLLEVYHSLRTREEIHAFAWAVQTYIPLNQPKPHPWYLATYERLVVEREHEVDRIFEFLGETVPKAAYEQLQVTSFSKSSAQDNSKVAEGMKQLRNWKDKLTAQQIDAILDVVHRVGIDCYSDALEPDYKKLSAYGE